MHVSLTAEPHRLTSRTRHHAFTTLARWHDRLYCAYRVAPSHAILPPGRIDIMRSGDAVTWDDAGHLTHAVGDIRDPRFLATADYLYCMVGIYLPSPQHQQPWFQGMTLASADNTLVTHLTFTRDGKTWGPLTPILRPNSWGWSFSKSHSGQYIASYDVGTSATPARHTLTLWSGAQVSAPLGMMYDGSSLERVGDVYQYPCTIPSEPVLYSPTRGTLACLVRTETTMHLGVWRRGRPWRWHDTGLLLHPSAIVETKHGWLMAARKLILADRGKWAGEESEASMAGQRNRYDTNTVLYRVDGNQLTHMLTLPSYGDCGYAGLAPGRMPDEWYVSWYSQHETVSPCSDVYVGRVRIEA